MRHRSREKRHKTIDQRSSISFKTLLLMHGAFLIYSFVGVFSKNAAQHAMFSPSFLLFAGATVGTLGIYALCWQQILRRVPLNRAYSSKGVVVLWNLLWAALFMNETITLQNIVGGIVILWGATLVSGNED